eukprot:scaffold2828_cov126-Cylindrotheca_fusiformis.AAC.4
MWSDESILCCVPVYNFNRADQLSKWVMTKEKRLEVRHNDNGTMGSLCGGLRKSRNESLQPAIVTNMERLDNIAALGNPTRFTLRELDS